MEKKQLLLITKNPEFFSQFEMDAGSYYEITTVKSSHAAYPIALSYLPDVIVIDCPSLGTKCLSNLQNFKSTHFLNKSFLFLIGAADNRALFERKYKDKVDGLFFRTPENDRLFQQIEEVIKVRKCMTNYWKDSFMGLFNLLKNPVILLQDEKIIAMNDAFKKDFFITKPRQLVLTDLVKDKNKYKVKETLRKFLKGKHMKAATTTSLSMNGKLREAKITFSKLDKALSGQMIMMINFTGKEVMLNEQIGSSSIETENYFAKPPGIAEECEFTKREKEVISLLCKGYKTKEISEALCISPKTIEKHRSNIIKRTHSGTIVESIVYALNNNMIEL